MILPLLNIHPWPIIPVLLISGPTRADDGVFHAQQPRIALARKNYQEQFISSLLDLSQLECSCMLDQGPHSLTKTSLILFARFICIFILAYRLTLPHVVSWEHNMSFPLESLVINFISIHSRPALPASTPHELCRPPSSVRPRMTRPFPASSPPPLVAKSTRGPSTLTLTSCLPAL